MQKKTANGASAAVFASYQNNTHPAPADNAPMTQAPHPAAGAALSETRLQQRLADARAHCARRGAQLTAQRAQVLELLLRRGGQAKAYDLQDDMQARHHGRVAPTTVYRALDFLQAHQLVHKVDATNTFFACDHSHSEHLSLLLICTACGRVEEAPDTHALEGLLQAAAQRGFAPQAVEVKSLCAHCQHPPAPCAAPAPSP